LKIVVDASVAIKWFLRENLNEEADRLLGGDYRIIAPDFILLEAANIVWKKIMRDELDERDCDFILNGLKGFLSELHPFESLIDRTQKLANQLKHPIYDCLYLAVACENNAAVVTADRRFYDRVQNSDYSKQIAWIETPPAPK
jgi:predicted nucleic acid-binding protein